MNQNPTNLFVGVCQNQTMIDEIEDDEVEDDR